MRMAIERDGTAVLMDVIDRVLAGGVVMDTFVSDGRSETRTTTARISVVSTRAARDSDASPPAVFGSGSSSKSALSVDDEDEE